MKLLHKIQIKEIHIHLFILTIAQCFFFFALNEPFQLKFIYAISTFIFYLLIGNISKQLLNFFIIFFFVITCFVFPTLRSYGNIGFNYITAIFYTNSSEIFSYIKVVDKSIYLFLFLLGIYSFYIIKITQKPILHRNYLALLLLVLLTISTRIYFTPDKNKVFRYVYVAPLNKAIKIGYFYHLTQKHNQWIVEESKKSSTWNIVQQPNQLPNKNIVVVIGESVRKDFLHSYGFPIKNTSFIDTSKHIQFNNYISTASHTIESLTRTIAVSNNHLKEYELNNNIVSLANTLGYQTYWISNQGKIGKYNSPISIMALHSDSCFFFSKGNFSIQLDREMLPYFYKVIKQDKTPKMIVLHMYGSHPTLSDRTGGVYDEFLLSEQVSFYNKTIKNTDEFLKDIYTALTNTNQHFDLIYLSDHGLKIKDDNTFIHSEDTKEVYHVPLLYWNSQMTHSQQINAIRTGKDFLHFFSEIASIKTENIKRNYRFISEEKNDDNGIQILGGVSYENLKNNSIRSILEKK